MAAARKLSLTILGNAKGAIGALSATQASSKSFSNTIASISKKVTVAFGAVSAAGIVLGKQVADGLIMATKAAAEDQKSQELLARQVRETVGATNEQIASLEQFISKTQFSAAVADSELRPALANLVRATGDLDKAQQLLRLSLDVSAGAGKGVEEVSLGLAKAYNGNIGALTRLGVPIDENTKKTKDFAAAQVELQKQFGGASATAANTFEGQMKKVKIAIDETVETIGYAIINNPQFQKAFEAITKGAQVFAENLGDKGIKGATYMALAAMGDFGRGTIDVIEAVTTAVLKLLEKLLRWTQTAAEAVALLAAAKGNAVLAAKAMGTAYFAMKGLEGVRSALSGLPEFFDQLRRGVEGAALAMNQFGGNKSVVTINEQYENWGKKIPKVKKAQEELDTTIGGSSKTIETAQDKLKTFIDALKKTGEAQKAAKEATKALKSANEDLLEANVRLAQAQEAFNQAVRGYGKESTQAKNQQVAVNKAVRGVERANYGVEQATFAVKDAEKELAEVRADPESNPQMIREAEIRLAEAKLSVVDAIDAQAEAVRDQAEAERKLDVAINGVKEGTEEYNDLLKDLQDAQKEQLAAIDRVTEAREREAEAIYEVAKAERELAEVRAATPDPIERIGEAEVNAGKPQPVTVPSGTTSPVVNVAKAIRDAFVADQITGADVALYQQGVASGRVANINIEAGMGDPIAIANAVIDALKQYERVNGVVPITAQYVAG